MKKFWTLAIALLGSLALTAPAQANLLLDGFGDDQGPVVDDTLDGTGESDGPIPITDTDFSNVTRTITAFLDTSGGFGSSSQVAAGAGGGVYDHSQTDGDAGHSEVIWAFDSTTLADPITIIASIRSIDLTASLEFTLEDGSGATDTKTVTVNAPGSQIYQFGSFDGLDMTDITGASLLVDGSETDSLDMSLDFVEVPTPGILGLLGIGLAGLAVFSRRRGK